MKYKKAHQELMHVLNIVNVERIVNTTVHKKLSRSYKCQKIKDSRLVCERDPDVSNHLCHYFLN